MRTWRVVLFSLVAVIIILAIFLAIFLTNTLNSQDEFIVITNQGSFGGSLATDGDYIAFLGIPYGIVNESNPFGAPQPHPKLDEVFRAEDDSVSCPQSSGGVVNCLQLNIFVPKSNGENNRLPVMVWIHGGGFESGSKRIGPKFILRHEVILVAINYRLGPYGFMCLDIPEAPGNQGIKDQRLAFRWIRDNIEAFGGDINKITAFGESAGGHSIDFHILSDSEKLFSKAIIQSGSSVASTVFTEHDKLAPIKIAAQLGFTTTSLTEALSYLSKVEATSVIRVSRQLGITYKPCTEQKFDNVESFLTIPWVNASTPKAKDMPILIGFNEHEMLMNYINPASFNNLTVISRKLRQTFNFDDDHLVEMEKLIHNFYFGDKEITPELIIPVTLFDSDYTYIHPVQRSINKFLEGGAANIFYYMFAYNGGRNLIKAPLNITIGSAVHADELGYLFDFTRLADRVAPEDILILNRMTTMWTNFAKFSDPTPETSELLPVKWLPITDTSYNSLVITTNMAIVDRPASERMAFWDEFYKNNRELQKGYFL